MDFNAIPNLAEQQLIGLDNAGSGNVLGGDGVETRSAVGGIAKFQKLTHNAQLALSQSHERNIGYSSTRNKGMMSSAVSMLPRGIGMVSGQANIKVQN
jgi:hypothetical protein